MSRERDVIVVIVLLAVLAIGAWAILKDSRAEYMYNDATATETSQYNSSSVTIDLPLELHHTSTGRTHTYTGSVWVPSSCDTLSSGIQTEGINPPRLTIKVSVNNEPCSVTVKTRADFLVSFTSTDTEEPAVDAVYFGELQVPYTVIED